MKNSNTITPETVLFADLVQLIAGFTTEDVAKRYRVSIQAVKMWRKGGKIVPTLRIPGRLVRYSLADLQRFERRFESKTEATTPARG